MHCLTLYSIQSASCLQGQVSETKSTADLDVASAFCAKMQQLFEPDSRGRGKEGEQPRGGEGGRGGEGYDRRSNMCRP